MIMKNLPSTLGSDPFKEWIKEKFSHLRFQKEIPESRQLAPTPEKIIGLVCDHFKVERELVGISLRGVENPVRDVAIYLVRHHSQNTILEVGRHFGIGNYSTVSSAVERTKSRAKQDRTLQRHLKKIEMMLAKSQQEA